MKASVFQNLAFLVTMLSLPQTPVYACEGECIVAITNAFISNYTSPVLFTLSFMANQIASQLLPADRSASSPLTYLDPVISAYRKNGYNVLEKAIFPSYFHGKCQDAVTNVNPPGCPNPDCPVVCGTPGSLIHFYPTLRYIAYNATLHTLQDFLKPGSTVFNQVQEGIQDAISHNSKVRRTNGGRGFSDFSAVFPYNRYPGGMVAKAKRDNHVKDTLARIFHDLRATLEKRCGGTGSGITNGLPDCSWEQRMKEFILTFP